jgi:hypothetical protein
MASKTEETLQALSVALLAEAVAAVLIVAAMAVGIALGMGA